MQHSNKVSCQRWHYKGHHVCSPKILDGDRYRDAPKRLRAARKDRGAPFAGRALARLLNQVKLSLGRFICLGLAALLMLPALDATARGRQAVLGEYMHLIVYTTSELEYAVRQSNEDGYAVINLADGVYNLDKTLDILGDYITLRSLNGDASRVTLKGSAMAEGASPGNLITISGKHVALSGLTLQDAGNHLVQLRGEADADHFSMTGCILRDAWQQLFKVSKNNNGNSADRGNIRNSVFEYSAGIGPQYYIGGIDMHGGSGWLIRDNTFRHIASPRQRVAEYAIHLWGGSSDNVVEHNLIIDSDRGIGFGLGPDMSRGNRGGVIRHNTIVHTNTSHPYADVGIALESSPGTVVKRNVIFMEHKYPNAIEYRFGTTTGVQITGNRTNKAIRQRDGAKAVVDSNTGRRLAQQWIDRMHSGVEARADDD